VRKPSHDFPGSNQRAGRQASDEIPGDMKNIKTLTGFLQGNFINGKQENIKMMLNAQHS